MDHLFVLKNTFYAEIKVYLLKGQNCDPILKEVHENSNAYKTIHAVAPFFGCASSQNAELV